MLAILTLIHTALSFIALALGIPAINALLTNRPATRITRLFILTAWATTLTGYLFPFNGVTPAILTGIVAIAALSVVYLAQHFKLKGHWRWLYVTGMVANLYLLVFVTIAQAFLKIPALTALAPTGTEAPFAIAQLLNLALFGYIGYRAVRRFAVPAAKPAKLKKLAA